MQDKDFGPQINLSKVPFDQDFHFDCDPENTPWMGSILDELEELTDKEDPDYVTPKLKFELTFKRKQAHPFGDCLVVTGSFSCQYITPCVRCLIPTHQAFEDEINVGFVPGHLEKSDEFKDEPSVFLVGEERDLYFHNKGKAELLECLREQVFVNADFFPLHDPECKGLCAECGVNKNQESCSH